MKAGIYIIKNLNSGKCYIGKTHDLHSRILSHKNALKRNKHNNKSMQDDYNAGNRFEFDILFETEYTRSKEPHSLDRVLLGLEIYYTVKIDADILGYNIFVSKYPKRGYALKQMITPDEAVNLLAHEKELNLNDAQRYGLRVVKQILDANQISYDLVPYILKHFYVG